MSFAAAWRLAVPQAMMHTVINKWILAMNNTGNRWDLFVNFIGSTV